MFKRVGTFERITLPAAKLDQQACLAAWLLHLPGQHPFWEYYELGLITLRDIPGVRPANKEYPEAEFEIVLIALNPDHKPSANDLQSLVPLTPLNYQNQFHGISDAQAIDLAEIMVGALIFGEVLAEPQGIIGARELWNKKIERYVEGYKRKTNPCTKL